MAVTITGVPVPPKSAEGNVGEWLKLVRYSVKLDSIEATGEDTGENVLAYLSPNIFIESIGWKTADAFVVTSDDCWPMIHFGDSADPKKWGCLGPQHLGSTTQWGEIPIHYETTSTAGVSLVADLGYVGDVDSDAAAGLDGQVDLWLNYRTYAASPVLGGKKAK